MASSASACLVTGGAGFIGSHIVRQLLDDGRQVTVIDNLSTGSRDNLAEVMDRITFIEGDIRSSDECDRACRGVDTVFHVAALPSVPRSIKDPVACNDHNVNGTLQVLEAARRAGARRVVYSSSSSVYGDTAVLPKVETMEPLCRSPYATAKLAGEQYVLAYARAGLLEGVALRYFNVFGPRQSPTSAYAAVIPVFLNAAQTGETATVFGDGDQTRDFTYVANVVDANMLAAFGPAARVNGWVANAGAGSRISLNQLLDLVESITGRRVQRTYGPPRAGDVRDSQASLDRAAQVLGYRPSVNVEEGLRRTWEWFSS
ncbi:MAG TPA: SDR family NAD(P)-dependent oxidoreductase [Gemmatimonadales bacterium]|nr:SDR family NAD(P)-dependent oxidoreductase [Gemmatimonadales bacterium]